MEKLSILALSLVIASSAHGSDNHQDSETCMTRLERLAQQIQRLKVTGNTNNLDYLNQALAECFTTSPLPKEENPTWWNLAKTTNEELTELLKAQSPTKTTSNPQITVSEA